MRLLVVILCVCLLGGCTSIRNRLYRDYAPAPLNKEAMDPYLKFVGQLTADESPIVPRECFSAPSAQNAATCRLSRNHAVSAMVVASGQLCVEHRRFIYGNDAAWNISMGTLTNVFAASAAVVSPERAKSILAALAVFANAERSLVNETVYKQMLITAVDKKILETREVKLQVIDTRMKQSIEDFSMYDAIRSIVDLHQSCSFMDGLQKALEEGTTGGKAQKILRLRAALSSVSTEMNSISVADRTATRKEEFDALKERYETLSNKLMALESDE